MQPLRQPLHVYLASALTNIKSDENEHSAKLRADVQRTFREFKHDQYFFDVYDPGLNTMPGSQHTAQDVYITDHSRTMSADLVFFLVNGPSHGAGMEVQIAADATIPKVVAFPKNERVSRMVGGIFSPTIAEIAYESGSRLVELLTLELPRIAKRVIESHRRRAPVVAKIAKAGLGQQITCQRILSGLSRADLAESTDIRENWLHELERDDKKMAGVTLVQLQRILDILDCIWAMGAGNYPSIHGNGERNVEELEASARSSLSNLATFARTLSSRLEDKKVLRMWGDYAEQQHIGIEGRSPMNQVNTIEDWERLYGDLGLF